ncbi:MAG: aldo/keto reductase [Chloroflexi bacterium]|nr:aldo/keto reductase [Chloroflexota bacterium]
MVPSVPDPTVRRPLGATGLSVTPLCVGCAALGSMPATFGFDVPEAQALATLRAAFAGPLNFVDTAAIYADGESERRVGLALRELGGLPPGVVLATKADRDPATNAFAGDQARRSVEGSLRRLGLDRLQLVYLHDPEYCDQAQVRGPGGALAALQALQRAGVIGHLGIAGGPIDLMIAYVETGAFSVVITHNRYTLLNQTAGPLIEVAHRRGVAVVNAAPYGSGLLAKGPTAYPRYAYREAPAAVVAAAAAMEAACARHGVSLAAAALQFSLRDPRITSTIVGMTRPERIGDTLALARQPLPDGLWAELAALRPPMGDPQADD